MSKFKDIQDTWDILKKIAKEKNISIITATQLKRKESGRPKGAQPFDPGKPLIIDYPDLIKPPKEEK